MLINDPMANGNKWRTGELKRMWENGDGEGEESWQLTLGNLME